MKKYVIMLFAVFIIGGWAWHSGHLPNSLLFVLLIPLLIVINDLSEKKSQNLFITIFVIIWLGFFHYESVRGFILNNAMGLNAPKMKFLFPPAGWIMFYRVDKPFGHVDVYGVTENGYLRIDPHDIVETRTIMYDNIHRGILGAAADQYNRQSFCRLLTRKFPQYKKFAISYEYYPDPVANPQQRVQRVLYTCVSETAMDGE